MWDTSKDYRLRVVEKSVDLFIRTAQGANLKGIWNKQKCLLSARAMLPIIQVMYFSYMEPSRFCCFSTDQQSQRKGQRYN